MLDVVVFGRIAVGKSALLNAVFGGDWFDVDVLGGTTSRVDTRIVTFEGLTLRIMDTPGIGEVAGSHRAEAARSAAGRAALILAIFDHEPTGFEFDAIHDLARLGKPLLVVLNKSDVLSAEDRDRLYQQVQHRVRHLVHPDNVLVCAASPMKHRVREWPDGRVEEWSERDLPDVGRLRDRLLGILRDEGQMLEVLGSLAREAEERQLLTSSRKRWAEELIDRYAAGMATGLALNPMPLVDFFAGGAAIVALAAQLAHNYDVEVTNQEVKDLAQSLVSQGWRPLWPAVLPLIGGSLLKGIPFLGWVLSAAGLGIGGFYLTQILGQALDEYFSQDKQWSVSIQATLDRIIERTDRASVCRKAAYHMKLKI